MRVTGIFLVVLAVSLSGARAGDDPIGPLLNAFRDAKSPEERIGVVTKLTARGGDAGAEALARIARGDPDVTVRVAAVEGLGHIRSETSRDLLADLLVHGGVRAVRAAIARSLIAQDGGREAILGILGDEDAEPLTRGLAIEAAGVTGDRRLSHALAELAGSDDAFLRTKALRALAGSEDSRELLRFLLPEVLSKRRDAATVMTVLDLVEARPDPDLLPLVERLATFLVPGVKDAVEHALDVLRIEKKKALAAKAAKDGYGVDVPGTPKEPPGPRPRFDLVFAFDSTGSLWGHLPKVLERIRRSWRILADTGCDVRVGIIVFRAARPNRKYAAAEVLPLTYDLANVDAFLSERQPGGADSQGASVLNGLTEGMKRMGWRWNAARTFTLVADSRCHDPAACLRMVRLHRAADRTRIRVLYVLRTRTTVPDDVTALARAGGGTVEIIE